MFSEAFLHGLPKAELHVHIEGTVTPRQRWDLAKRNSIELPFSTFEELVAAHEYAAESPGEVLRRFLELYYANHVVFKTEQDYRDVMYEHLRRCAEGNIRYAEIYFGAQAHLALGVPLPVLMGGLRAGIEEGERDFGVAAGLILSINRGHSAESGFETVRSMVPYQDIVVGIGMGGLEPGNPPEKHKDAFAFARAEGWHVTCHCDVDQEDAVKHMWQCLDVLKVDRIDHGINALDDAALIDALNTRDIYLTPCPTWWPGSNDPYRLARIRQMYDAGLNITLNSDDPGMMTSGMLHELLPRVTRECAFTHEEIGHLMANAFKGAWLPDAQRAGYLRQLEAHLAADRTASS